MALQKEFVNGHPVVTDTVNPGVPLTNLGEDGGDIVAANAAWISSHITVLGAFTSAGDGNITNTQSIVSSNSATILSHTSSIAANAAAIAINQADIAALDADSIDDTSTAHKFATAAQLAQIATNQTDIGTNTAWIAGVDADDIDDTSTTNKFATAAELTQIATNQTDIGTNVSAIAVNAAAIAGLDADDIDPTSSRIWLPSPSASDISKHLVVMAAGSVSWIDFDAEGPNKGGHDDLAALALAYPVGQAGWYATLVNPPSGPTTGAVWSVTLAAWVEETPGGITAVNGDIGPSVTLDADDIDDSITTHKFATAAELALIATNQTDIATNAAWIAGVDADDIDDTSTSHKFATAAQLTLIATNQTDIATNVSDIATNAAWIAGVDADDIDDTATVHKFATAAQLTLIATNQADIATNVADIATNVSDISVNAALIVTNAGDISTNAANISSNDTDISTINATLSSLSSSVSTNTSNISTNTADIATNTGDVATNVADISVNATAIAGLVERFTTQALTDNEPVEWTLSNGHMATLLGVGNNTRTLSIPVDIAAGDQFRLEVTQPASGGPYNLDLSAFLVANGIAISLTTAAGARDILVFDAVTPTRIWCNIIRNGQTP